MEINLEIAPEVSWPQILLDQIARLEGMILFSGSRQAEPLAVIKAIRRQHGDKKIAVAANLNSRVRSRELEEADIVIYHGLCEKDATLALLDLCEEGRLVVHIVMAPSVVSALHKVMSALVGEGEKHFLWRYVDQLSLMVNQMQVATVNESLMTIHEMILGTPEIKNLLLEKRISEIEQNLKDSPEDRGMVSFNQVLLKLLIRRRIDLKTAFQKTRDPEHLDLLLKRVGV